MRPASITTLASRSLYHPVHTVPTYHRSTYRSGWGRNYGVWSNSYRAYPNDAHLHHHSSLRYPSLYHTVNYAYRPGYWGYRPWWGGSYYYPWYSGSWNYGWGSHWNRRYAYYRRPLHYYPPGYGLYYASSASFVPWGLASWTLGSLAYDTGYYSYYNPYPAPPVTVENTVIRYSEPITVIAANDKPASEEIVATAAEKASVALDRAREAFRVGDYVSASSAIDEAISHTPGDPVLHEFRALTLFALGRYDDAAGVLNSVLASGPGWNWDTMIGFYDNPDRYTDQFRKLEDYVVSNPDSAAPHFLLGYHYMVCGSLPEAKNMFDQVVDLQPRDTVAKQLQSLLGDSVKESPDEEMAKADVPPEVEANKKAIVAEDLHGIWKAKSADDKWITLSLTPIGTFTWSYEGASADVLSGEWSLDDDGLLVLADKNVQMIGDIDLNSDGTLHFLLAGSPDGDPGLTFKKE